MLELVSNWFVGKPATLLLVSGLFAVGWFVARSAGAPRPQALLWAALTWLVWAAWEFAILRFSPEADIRVDLLILLPAIFLVSLASLILTFRRPGGG